MGAPRRRHFVCPPDLEDVRQVFHAHPPSRVQVLRDAPGAWNPPGAVFGLDLYDGPGTLQSRQRSGNRMRRQPRVPVIPAGTPPGPRVWYCPGWLELPMPDRIPLDGWYFDRCPRNYTPAIWFQGIWDEGVPGEDDPTRVAMVWIHAGRARCPGTNSRALGPSLPFGEKKISICQTF